MYVIARSKGKRPTLMHQVAKGGMTLCGRDMTGWSRNYLNSTEARLIESMLCYRCSKGAAVRQANRPGLFKLKSVG